jgi:hypothetical protein
VTNSCEMFAIDHATRCCQSLVSRSCHSCFPLATGRARPQHAARRNITAARPHEVYSESMIPCVGRARPRASGKHDWSCRDLRRTCPDCRGVLLHTMQASNIPSSKHCVGILGVSQREARREQLLGSALSLCAPWWDMLQQSASSSQPAGTAVHAHALHKLTLCSRSVVAVIASLPSLPACAVVSESVFGNSMSFKSGRPQQAPRRLLPHAASRSLMSHKCRPEPTMSRASTTPTSSST